MDLFLQIWGGSFYLANKICFSIAEGCSPLVKQRLRLIGWIVYILGVPPWVSILIIKHNWIAASIETGGLPSMFFGLYMAAGYSEKRHKGFNSIATFSTYAFIILGTVYSIYDYGGLKSLVQFLETGVMIGFLLGSYLLAKKNISGWLFFILMNVSMGILMFLQQKSILVLQQGVSLCFVVYGYLTALKASSEISSKRIPTDPANPQES